MITRAMLMSAGLGTRLRPFTESVSKPVLPLLGVPMAQFALDAMKAAGLEHVVANVHHLASHTASALRFMDRPADLQISDESSLLLGSAGGLARALPLLKREPFFLMNADTIASINLQDLMRQHQRLRHDHGVKFTLAILKRSPLPGKYREIYFDEKRGLIRGASEEKLPSVPFFMGVAVIEPEALDGISADEPSDFPEKILFPTIRQGRAGFYLVDNTILPDQKIWFDIGDAVLWHRTHLDFMDLWEEGELPTLWRARLERSARRLGAGIFVSSQSNLTEAPRGWKAPCYWGPDLADTTPPETLDSGMVIYGKRPPDARGAGIGFRGLWKSLEK